MPLLEHNGMKPDVHSTAYVAPNAMVCGNVTIAADSCVLFGAVITAETGSISIGTNSIIMENAVVRANKKHPTSVGDHVLIGPHAHITGATIHDCAFIATGASVFNGASVGTRSEVRINGVVHVNSNLLPDTTVPIGWVAVGRPARLFSPDKHDEIWVVQQEMEFTKTVFGQDSAERGGSIMPALTQRYSRALHKHQNDKIVESSE